MAKRNTPKSDAQEPITPERRRRSDTTRANGAAEAAPRAPRTRRRTDAAPAVQPEAATAAVPMETPSPEPSTAANTPLTSSLQELAAPAAVELAERTEVPHEHIAVRAYHLYLERGARAGGEFEDWITAERELRERAAGNRLR